MMFPVDMYRKEQADYIDLESFGNGKVLKNDGPQEYWRTAKLTLYICDSPMRKRTEVYPRLPFSLPDGCVYVDKPVHTDYAAAHNAFFDATGVAKYFKAPKWWLDSAAVAYAIYRKRSLREALVAAGLDPKFNVEEYPEEPTEELLHYAIQDAQQGRRLLYDTLPYINDDMLIHFLQDFQYNWRGIKVDRKLAEHMVRCYEQNVAGLDGKMLRSNKQFAEKLGEFGVAAPNHRKETLLKLLVSDIPNEAKTLIEQRIQVMAKGSAKVRAFLKHSEQTGRVHDYLKAHGCHTGRPSGRRVQLLNLRRESADPAVRERVLSGGTASDKEMSGLIRTLLLPDRKYFAIADFSQVEARILAWYAGEEYLLEAFRNKEDPYLAFASKIGASRQVGKTGVLSAGYGIGGKTMQDRLDAGGIAYDGKQLVAQYRSANRQIVALWKKFGDASHMAVRQNIPSWVSGVGFAKIGNNLAIQLPSGRCLIYPNISMTLEYEDEIKGRIRLYGGMIAQNVTQATAFDLLLSAMPKVEKVVGPVVLHVYDEIVCDTDLDDGHVRLTECMLDAPEWAKDIPLAAEGFISPWYRK